MAAPDTRNWTSPCSRAVRSGHRPHYPWLGSQLPHFSQEGGLIPGLAVRTQYVERVQAGDQFGWRGRPFLKGLLKRIAEPHLVIRRRCATALPGQIGGAIDAFDAALGGLR